MAEEPRRQLTGKVSTRKTGQAGDPYWLVEGSDGGTYYLGSRAAPPNVEVGDILRFSAVPSSGRYPRITSATAVVGAARKVDGPRPATAPATTGGVGSPDDEFVNAYNFIRTSRSSPKRLPFIAHDRFDKNLLNGEIVCRAENLTPLMVGGRRLEGADREEVSRLKNISSTEHKIIDFTRHRNEITIPATSFKGMIRGVFEAVTNSCMTIFDGKPITWRPQGGAAAGGRVRPDKRQTPPLRELVAEETRCENINQLCPACRLFGMVPLVERGKRGSEEGIEAYAGRVFPYRGRPVGDHHEPTWRTLPILSSPKPEAFEFYLNNPGDPAQAINWDDALTRGARLRGRKFYWHHETPLPSRVTSDKQNATVNLLEDKVTFELRVRFHNLERYELGALLWSLAPSDAKGERLCHKLGMGKPLGLGSLKTEVRTMTLIDRVRRYQSLLDDGEEPSDDKVDEFVAAFREWLEQECGQPFAELGQVKDLSYLLRFPGPNRPVMYPKIGDEKQGYQWWVGMRKRRGGPVTLPLPEEESEGKRRLRRSDGAR